MQCLLKKKKVGKKSESGFVLIVALIGIMILLAVGFYATTIATSELMIASRIAGERKAFSAAEAGVHALISSFNAGNLPGNDTSWKQVDSVEDSKTYYSVTGSAEVGGLTQACTGAFSIEGGLSWQCPNYRSTVTGKDESYKSQISIDVGIKGRAVPYTPSYDF